MRLWSCGSGGEGPKAESLLRTYTALKWAEICSLENLSEHNSLILLWVLKLYILRQWVSKMWPQLFRNTSEHVSTISYHVIKDSYEIIWFISPNPRQSLQTEDSPLKLISKPWLFGLSDCFKKKIASQVNRKNDLVFFFPKEQRQFMPFHFKEQFPERSFVCRSCRVHLNSAQANDPLSDKGDCTVFLCSGGKDDASNFNRA